MTTQPKKLTRLPDEGQIAGICAGLAKYFVLDVTLVRVIFIILAIVSGGGFVLVYLIMALVIPAERGGVVAASSGDFGQNVENLSEELRISGRDNRLRNYFGIGLIIFGTWLFLTEVFPGWFDLRWNFVWPVVLIVLGVYIATRRKA